MAVETAPSAAAMQRKLMPLTASNKANKRPLAHFLGAADQTVLKSKGTNGADGSAEAIGNEVSKVLFLDHERDLPDLDKLNAKDARNLGAALYQISKQCSAAGGMWPIIGYSSDDECRPTSAAPTAPAQVLGGPAGAQVWDPVLANYKWVRPPSEIATEKDDVINHLKTVIAGKDDIIKENDKVIASLRDDNSIKQRRLELLDLPGAVFDEVCDLVGDEMLTRFSRQCSAIRLLGIGLVSRLKFLIRGDARREMTPLFVETYPHDKPGVHAWGSHSAQRVVVLDPSNWTRVVAKNDVMTLLVRHKDGRAAASGATASKKQKHTLGATPAELIVVHLHFDGTAVRMVGEL